jgi:hypothetical protein
MHTATPAVTAYVGRAATVAAGASSAASGVAR